MGLVTRHTHMHKHTQAPTKPFLMPRSSHREVQLRDIAGVAVAPVDSGGDLAPAHQGAWALAVSTQPPGDLSQKLPDGGYMGEVTGGWLQEGVAGVGFTEVGVG